MPRLPDRDSLGARPIPRANRNVVSVAGRGNLAQVGTQIGDRIAQFGQGMIDKEDKMSYAAAKAKILAEDTKARQEFQDDPDYETFEPRYQERMAKVRADALGMIKSRSDRQLFEADVSVDLARGLGEVQQTARGKRITAGKAQLNDAVFSLQDSALNADDEPTRIAALSSINDLYDGAMEQGLLDPIEAGNAKRKAAESYTVASIDRKMMIDDVAGARQLLEENRGRLDTETETKIEAQLIAREQGREAVTLAEESVYGAAVTPINPATPDGGATSDQYFKSLVIQESGGRPGVKGPDTPYGNALGMTQMLPETAKQMAKKLGVPWQPALMTGTSKEAADYQLLLGRAYFDEGLQRYGGDVRKALMYYHGGPDQKIWGPKTRAYAEQVISRANGGTMPIEPGPRQYDKQAVYRNIDARATAEGWSIEKRERVREQADRMVQRDEGLLRRKQEEAYDQALTIADKLGEKFTDISQLGAAGRDLSPEQRHTMLARAQQNREPKEVKANGDAALTLELLAIKDPKAFSEADLRGFRHLLTPSEFSKLALDQAKMRAGGVDNPNANIRAEIHTAIQFHGADINLDIGDRKNAKQREKYMKVSGAMRAYLDRVTEGKRRPTDDEMKAAFDNATMVVFVDGDEKRRFELSPEDGKVGIPIPRNIEQRIIQTYRQATGKTPAAAEIGRIYLQNKGRQGFWQ